MAAGITTTAALVQAVEARLLAEVSDLSVPDRLGLSPDSAGRKRAHRGVGVTVPRSTTTETGGRGQWRQVEDRLEVQGLYAVRPSEQLASRNEALALEDSITAALTDRAWMGAQRIDVEPDQSLRLIDAEWIRYTLTFTVRRRATLG